MLCSDHFTREYRVYSVDDIRRVHTLPVPTYITSRYKTTRIPYTAVTLNRQRLKTPLNYAKPSSSSLPAQRYKYCHNGFVQLQRWRKRCARPVYSPRRHICIRRVGPEWCNRSALLILSCAGKNVHYIR